MVTFRSGSGELCRVVNRVRTATRDGSSLLRESVDGHGNEVRADRVFRLSLHRFAIAHIVLRQHEKAVLHTRLQRNLRRVPDRIYLIQLIRGAVDGMVEFELLNAAAALIIISREGSCKQISRRVDSG